LETNSLVTQVPGAGVAEGAEGTAVADGAGDVEDGSVRTMGADEACVEAIRTSDDGDDDGACMASI
jgi:hypothetical protein